MTPTPRFLERDESLYALQLAFAAGAHLLFLGVSGTAKSQLVRAASEKTGRRFFRCLMTEYTRDDDLFGPHSLQALREDRLERAVEGFLPTAEVAFLDEVFRAGKNLDLLLTAMNERVFQNGAVELRLPLCTLVGASNTWPEGDASLRAFYDRFLLRVRVDPVQDLHALVTGTGPGWRGLPDFAVAPALPVTPLSEEVCALLVEAVRKARATGAFVSDRRVVEAVRVLRAAAHLDGREEVRPDDLLALRFVLWEDPNEADTIERMLYHLTAPEIAEARDLMADLEEEIAALKPPDGSSQAEGHLMEVLSRARAVVTTIEKRLKTGVPTSRQAQLRAYHTRAKALQRRLLDEHYSAN